MTINTNRSRYFFIMCIATAMAGLLFCCKPAHEKEADNTVQPLNVFELQIGKLSSTLKIPAELASFRDVDLYAKVNSFVKKLYVDVGSEVKEGDLLALMEAPEIISQLASARSRVESQMAIYRASKANYVRLLQTSKTPGTISQNDLDQALGKSNSDSAQLEAAMSAQKEIAVMQSYLEIRAPFDGIISARNINAGAYVGPSGKGSEFPMFTLNEQKKLRLILYVPEAYSGYLHQNDEIQFAVKAYPNEKFTARIKRLAGTMDKRLRSQRIEMDVYNENKKLLPGMIAEVHLQITSSGNTFVVPASAVLSTTEKIFVIRVANKKAEWVEVKKGLEGTRQVEIFGALNPADQLVTAASEEMRDGSDIIAVKTISRPN